jgi:FkbM family methyltransferase
MDLGGLAVHGRFRTRTAWATNPVRRVLWWLVYPYFRGAGVEIDRHVGTKIDNRVRELAAETDNRVREVAAETDNRVRELAAETDKKLQAIVTSSQDAVRAAVASQLGSVRKDAIAVAHRLAGLEEEAALAAEARTALGNRVDSLVQARDALSEHITSLQQDVRAAVQILNERIDILAQGAPLRPGNRVSVGQGGLVIVASPGGTRYLVRQHDHIGRRIVAWEEWEPHVRMAIERAARPDGVAVDAGAYIGVHTVTMSRCFQTVYAFEPQRGIFQMLCGNLALNRCLNVIAHNAALYDRAGSMHLAPLERQEVNVPTCDGQPDYDHIENAAALSFEFVTDGNGDVRAIRLDDMSLEDVALIKVDTQGADLRVLRGAEETIRRCRPTVLFEWERDLGLQHGASLDAYYAFFTGLEYDLLKLQDTTPGRQADYIATPR